MSMSSPTDFFKHQAMVAYSSEQQILASLSSMIEIATDEKITRELEKHQEETIMQIARLEEVIDVCAIDVSKYGSLESKTAKGTIAENFELLSKSSAPFINDLLIVIGGAKIEHLEISYYKGLLVLTDIIEVEGIKELLSSSLIEEERACSKMESLAKELTSEFKEV